MNTPTTRRILRVVPLLAAVALSVGACATPWASGANASSTSTSSAANNATTNNTVTNNAVTNNAVTNNAVTNDAANGSGSQPAAQSAPAAQNGVTGGAAGTSGAAASAPSYTDYEALANQSRVFPQVKDEVDASYKRVMDFNTQICQAH